MRLNRRILSLLLLTGFAYHLPAHSETWRVGSFSATRVEFDLAQQNKEKKSKVYVSKQGIREEEQDGNKQADKQFAVVMNIEKGKTWFLVPLRKIYLEPPSADAPGVTTSEEPGTVLAPSPCSGYSRSEKSGMRSHEQRKVEEWHCRSGATGDITQLYDPGLHVVVRSEDKSGHVFELRGIVEGKQPETLFMVPEGYRKASLQEMMTGTTALPGYPESAESSRKPK